MVHDVPKPTKAGFGSKEKNPVFIVQEPSHSHTSGSIHRIVAQQISSIFKPFVSSSPFPLAIKIAPVKQYPLKQELLLHSADCLACGVFSICVIVSRTGAPFSTKQDRRLRCAMYMNGSRKDTITSRYIAASCEPRCGSSRLHQRLSAHIACRALTAVNPTRSRP